jgi:hypothetical protein
MTTLTYQLTSQVRLLVSPASFNRARRGARGVVFGSCCRPCEYGTTLHLQLPIVTNTSFLTLTNIQQRARFLPFPHLSSETPSCLGGFRRPPKGASRLGSRSAPGAQSESQYPVEPHR